MPLRTVPQPSVSTPQPDRQLLRIVIGMGPSGVVLGRLWREDFATGKHRVNEDQILASTLTAGQQSALNNIIDKMATL